MCMCLHCVAMQNAGSLAASVPLQPPVNLRSPIFIMYIHIYGVTVCTTTLLSYQIKSADVFEKPKDLRVKIGKCVCFLSENDAPFFNMGHICMENYHI